MSRPPIRLAGEGHLDLAVLNRLACDAGFEPAESYGRRGKSFVDQRLAAWNTAAQWQPWLVLRDLDQDAECAGALRESLVPRLANFMCFRIAVPEVENWLLADHDGCITHLGFRDHDIPEVIDEIVEPKQILLQAAAKSANEDIRDGVVVRPRGGKLEEGDNYNALLSAFVTRNWRPRIAATRCNSLRRARIRLAELATRWSTKYAG